MTLGECLVLLKAQCMDGMPRPAAALKFALEGALDSLAVEASRASGERMFYTFTLPLTVSGEVKLPEGVVATKDLWNVADKHAYTRINSTQGLQVRAVAAHGGPYRYGSPVFWVEHRTLHFRPVPSVTSGQGLLLSGWARTPLPSDQDAEVGIPSQALRWVLAKAATIVLPPLSAEATRALGAQLSIIDEDLRGWLWAANAGTPDAPTEEAWS